MESRMLPAKGDQFDNPTDSMRMGDDDIRDNLPILKICYTEKDGLKKGKLTLAGDKQFDSLNVVLLGARYVGNILWPTFDPSNEDPQPTCKSGDGVRPDGGDEPFDMSCADCGRTEWAWKDAHNEIPPCKKTTACLFWLVDEKFPAVMTVQRRARSTQFRGLRSALDRKVMQVIELTKSVPGAQVNWCFNLKMESVPYGKNVTYYLPQWTIEKQLNKKEVLEIQEIFAHAKPLFFSAGIQEIADGDALSKDQEVSTDPDDDLPF